MPRRNRNARRRPKPMRKLRGIARSSAGRSACPTGKVRFPDHLAAARALANLRTKAAAGADRRDVTPVRSYRCDLCHGHHLTSQPR